MADNEQREKLIAAAREAAKGAYAPYSNFHVGAALLLDDGSIVTGANVENASYGLTLCAETVAIATLANMGALRRLTEVAVVGGAAGADGSLTGSKTLTPCGRCRQMIYEAASLAGRDIIIHCAAGGGNAADTLLLSDLLPHAFGPADLGKG